MAEEKKSDEVFGEDFTLLDDGMEDFFASKFGDEGQSDPKDTTSEEDDEIEPVGTGEDTGEEADDNQQEETKVEEDADPDSNENSSSPLIPYAKYLKEEGILPNFDVETFDGSIDGLRDGMMKEIMGGVDLYKESLPDPIKRLINNYEQGVALKDLLEIDEKTTRYSSYTAEVLENEDAQKQLVRDYLLQTTRFSAEKIEKEINRLSDLQELEEEAKAILPELIAMQAEEEKALVEQAAASQREAEQARLQELETLRSTLESTDELIPGTKVSSVLRQKIYKNLTTPVAYSQDGVPLNKLGYYRSQNPVQTEILLNYIFEATNEFKDWSIFGKAAKRSVITDIENAARNMDTNFGAARNVNPAKSASASKFLKEIDNFDF